MASNNEVLTWVLFYETFHGGIPYIFYRIRLWNSVSSKL